MISISWTSSRWISARCAAVIFLPAWTISSRLPLASLGPKTAFESLRPDEVGRGLPEQPPLAGEDAVRLVEALEDLRVGLHPQRPQEHRGEELALAVDPHVEEVLGVELELHPAPAVGDDLGGEEPLLRLREEDARRAVELADDDPLRAVDDEGPVLRHQRDVAVVDLLLLDVADGLGAGLRVLVPDHEADRDLEGDGERHAPLLALVHVVLELQADRLVAGLAGDGRFSLKWPHFGQWISRSPRGSVMIVAAQKVQGRPSLSSPTRRPHLHSQFPIE